MNADLDVSISCGSGSGSRVLRMNADPDVDADEGLIFCGEAKKCMSLFSKSLQIKYFFEMFENRKKILKEYIQNCKDEVLYNI